MVVIYLVIGLVVGVYLSDGHEDVVETGGLVLFWPVVIVVLLGAAVVGSLGWLVKKIADRTKTPFNPW